MKKAICLLITGLLFLLPLGGCSAGAPASGSSAASSGSASKAQPKEQLTIHYAAFCDTGTVENFWTSFNDRAAEAYPDYKFQFEVAPGSSPEEYIKSKIAAGDFPDTMWVFQPALLIDGGIVQEIPSELEEMLLNPEAFKVNGKLYTMPLNSGALGIWYNKEIFKTAGISSLPETWDAFMADCEKIAATGIEPIGMSAKEGWYVAGLFNFLWSPRTYGPNLHWPNDRTNGTVKFNNPVTQRCLEQFAESMDYWQEGALSATYDEVKSLFFSGKVAMIANGGQYNAGEINSGEVQADFEIGYLLPPQDEAETRRVNEFSDNMFVINSEVQGEKLTAVTELLKFFYSKDIYPDFLTAVVGFPTVKGFEGNAARVDNPIAETMLNELYAAMREAGTVPHAHAAQGDDMWPSGCREMSEKICQEIAAGNRDFNGLMNLMDEQWDKGVEQARQG